MHHQHHHRVVAEKYRVVHAITGSDYYDYMLMHIITTNFKFLMTHIDVYLEAMFDTQF